MPYFNLKQVFITVLSQNNLTKLQLFVIMFTCVRISDWPQQAQAVNAVLFNLKLITLPLWSIKGKKWHVISMRTATTGLICLKEFESTVLFPQIHPPPPPPPIQPIQPRLAYYFDEHTVGLVSY